MPMKMLLAVVSGRRTGSAGAASELLQLYVDRAARYTPCSLRAFATEAKLLQCVEDAVTRTRPVLLLAESKGRLLSSEELAASINSFQESGTQQLILAVGPADGWSRAALSRADLAVSFGRITLPHELAAIVAAEQIYRAMSIRAGHPYHCGH